MVDVQVLEQTRRQTGLDEGRWIHSAQSGVWSECFRMTALPAASAGTMLFTAVSSG